jgi:hypothetical protein
MIAIGDHEVARIGRLVERVGEHLTNGVLISQVVPHLFHVEIE